MLAIARAIIEPRKLLLIDEPTKGWRRPSCTTWPRRCCELKAHDTTILLVEQNFHFVRSLGDHVAVMDDGRVVHAGSDGAAGRRRSPASRLLGLHTAAA